MCGGVGSRFWPFSRHDRPKQFLDFFGTGRSMLQMTFDRVSRAVGVSRIIIMTNADYADLVREQLPEIPVANILEEPSRRNTAPCIFWAARHIYALDPGASIVTLPSDHLILREDAFVNAIEEGLSFVETHDALLTLGIHPTSPKTGYGYIQRGSPVEGYPGIMRVKAFTEKPDEELARIFLQSGEFFWNSGIFLWSARSVLEAFRTFAPEIPATFQSGEKFFGTSEEMPFINRSYGNAPCISVDYAIMEKAGNVYVKTVDLGWSDLGTRKAFQEVSEENEDGNVVRNCKLVSRDCSGNVFASIGDKVIVAAGLKDYIVADNGNALLICPLSDEQKLRHAVNEVADMFGEDYI